MDEGVTRLERGTVISVRAVEPIDASRQNSRLYRGIVDLNVFGNWGRLAIPRGSRVDLIVRVVRDGNLILDLDSVDVNGERYSVQSEIHRIDPHPENDLVGSIIGAVGGQVRGQSVRVPRNFVVTFELQRPLEIETPDRGSRRDDRR